MSFIRLKTIFFFTFLPWLLLCETCASRNSPPVSQTAVKAGESKTWFVAFAIHTEFPIYAAANPKSKKIGVVPIGGKLLISDDPIQMTDGNEYTSGNCFAVEAFVRTGKQDLQKVNGFIFRDSLPNDGLIAFHPYNPGVYTTALTIADTEIFEIPDVKSPVKARISANEILDVLAYNDISYPAVKRPPEWVFVRNKAAVTGYAPGTKVIPDVADSMRDAPKFNFGYRRGWLQVSGDTPPVFAGLENLAKGLVSKEKGIVTRPKKQNQGFIRIDGELTHQGKKFYLVGFYEPGIAVDDGQPFQKDWIIPAAAGTFFNDYFEISRNRMHNFPEKIIESYKLYSGTNLNLQCSSVSILSLGTGKTKKRYHILWPFFGPEQAGQECLQLPKLSPILLLEEKKVLKRVIEPDFAESRFIDLDGDGTPEILSSHDQDRGRYALSVFRIHEGKMIRIISQDMIELGQDCPTLIFQGRYAKIDYQKFLGEKKPGRNLRYSELKDHCQERTQEIAGKLSIRLTEDTEFPVYAELRKNKFVGIKRPRNLPADVAVKAERRLAPYPYPQRNAKRESTK